MLILSLPLLMFMLSVQMGLNGVDNGQIWFDNVRVSRDAMLDR